MFYCARCFILFVNDWPENTVVTDGNVILNQLYGACIESRTSYCESPTV